MMNQLYRALDAISSGICICNADLVTIYCNKAYEDVTGLCWDDIRGKTAHQMISEGWASNSVSLKVQEKKCKFSLIQHFPNKRTALVTGIPVFTKEDPGVIDMIVITVTDVTAQNNLYERLVSDRLLSNGNQAFLRKIIDKGIIQESPAMKNVISLCLRAAFSDAPILITGETGVGKEVAANIIHENSGRSNYNMIKVNCAAIPGDLAEAELFGYVDGAFTGAKRGGRPGMFEMANNGTIFLDEIGELSLALQSKLLRALQEHEIRPVGSSVTVAADFRVITATNQNLRSLVSQGKFRSDLYYRINVINITIPPLRERPEDIKPLLYSELNKLNDRYMKNTSFSSRAEDFLEQYNYPGNVRELRNIVERLFFISDQDAITFEDIFKYLDLAAESTQSESDFYTEDDLEVVSLKKRLQKFEVNMIVQALKKSNTMKDAAKLLQIDPATLTRKCQMYGIISDGKPGGCDRE